VPFLSNAAAGLAIQCAGSDEQKQKWLPGIASGEARGALGVVRNGEAKLVPDAVGADVIVLYGSDGAQLVEAANADIEALDVIDTTRTYATVKADGGDSLSTDNDAWDRFATAIAAELTGVAQRTMEMAVAYARDRKQFDRPIGAYQGVSHRCAQMLLETEGARSTTYYAGWCGDAEPESLPLAASMAKAYASDAGWRVTASALQVLGGIGFTWEHDLHFFLKRATVDGSLYGSASEHRDRVAELAGLSREPAPA
jgi:alkylation response protein AidB-like acyl-CoA dehydrogenase